MCSVIHRIEIYPVDSVIRPSNNRGWENNLPLTEIFKTLGETTCDVGRYPLRDESPRTSIVSLQFFTDELAGYVNFAF